MRMTQAQRRDTVLIGNEVGNVRRALNYYSRNVTHENLTSRKLIEAIRSALAVAKVRKVHVDVIDASDGERVVLVVLGNLDQTDKARDVMRRLGFACKHYQHWVLNDDMVAEGFSLP